MNWSASTENLMIEVGTRFAFLMVVEHLTLELAPQEVKASLQ